MEGFFGGLISVLLWILIRAFWSSRRKRNDTPLSPPRGDGVEGRTPGGSLALQARLQESYDVPGMDIQVKGFAPPNVSGQVAFVTSIFDVSTGETAYPVYSVHRDFQEPQTYAFQQVRAGVLPPGGLPDWRTFGVVIPGVLVGPYEGRRELAVFVRLVDTTKDVRIVQGAVISGKEGVLWESVISCTCDLEIKGYLRQTDERRRSQYLAIRIAAAVALSDDTLDDDEVNVIERFAEKWINEGDSWFFNDLSQIERARALEANIKTAIDHARSGLANVELLTRKLREVGTEAFHYETIELCHDVMAADKVADPRELKILDRMAASLGLNPERVRDIRDRKILELGDRSDSSTSIEEFLGIDSSWDRAKIKKHLRAEFHKWNSRFNALPEGPKREKAQHMLDMISEANQKYRGR